MYLSRREKAASATASLTIVGLTAYALVTGLAAGIVTQSRDALVAVFVTPQVPPPPPPRPKRETIKAKAPAAKDDPSPKNLKNEATPVFAPKLPPLIVPPPITSATQPAQGDAGSSGAANVAGPGQGAGGIGDGRGGGGSGGDGDGGGIATGPRQIRGKLSFEDLPRGLLAPGSEARVGVRYVVEVDGRVSQCRADEPSGVPGLDALACRLIEERFRFRPARNHAGRPVPATVVEAHSWFVRVDRRPQG